MGYVTPVTKASGDGLTAADWNAYVRDNQEALFTPPRCLVDRSTAQSIPDVTVTSMTFDTELLDNDSMHSTTSNTSRITAKTAGLYMMTTSVQFTGNTTGGRTVSIVLNGAQTLATSDLPSVGTGPARLNVATLYYLDVDDYVESRVYQSSGGALNVQSTSDSPNFRVAWVGG